MLEYTTKKEGTKMTDIELSKARIIYKLHKKGQKDVLENVSHGSMNFFLKTYMNITQEKIASITDDEMLRRAFLSVFQNTKESNNLLVYLNRIVRINDKIDDGQPDLVSIGWKESKFIPENFEKKSITEKQELKAYSLYCDLETNRPLLLGDNIPEEFDYLFNILLLPDYIPQEESYHFNCHSLEKITKGSATIPYERLQLYYFKELLKASKKEEVVQRMKCLTKRELTSICLK